MSINNILGQPAASFDPNLAAIQGRTLDAIEGINHSKRDPRATEALQELGRRMVEAVTDVDRIYGIDQYLADLQLVVKGPGQFNLFINEREKDKPAAPLQFGREQRSIQLYEDAHGKQESREGIPGPSSEEAGRRETGSRNSAPASSGGARPAVGIGESLPIAPG